MHISKRGRGMQAAAGLAAAAVLGLSTATSAPASAYDGNQAANYADLYAMNPNTNYIVFGEDCTNFVSQSVNHGGFSMVGYGSNAQSASVWWLQGAMAGGFNWSLTWSVADSYYNFLLGDLPGGVPEGSAPGTSNNFYTPDSVVTGDVLFYDWGKGEGISHAAIQTGIGTAEGDWYGNYIDEHTTNRYHAFWSLVMYNANYLTTTVYFMHIAANNN